MKAVFVKARSLKVGDKTLEFKAGQPTDLPADQFETLENAGYVVTASQWDMMERQKADGIATIKATIAGAKKIGAIEAKDETVQTDAIGRFERGEASASIICELINARHSQSTENELTVRATARVLDPNGEPVKGTPGFEVKSNDFKHSIRAGYMEPRANMDKLIRAGQLKQAIQLSTDTGIVLRDETQALYARGGDFSIKDVVKAADNVDPSVGTLGTGLVLMRNLGFLKNKLNFLDKISTDLRNEPVMFGQNVLTRYITPPTVLTFVPGIGMTSDAATIAAWKATITASNPAGTVQTTGTQTLSTPQATDVSVVLNLYKGVEITFNNLQLAGTMRNLFAEQQAAQIYSLAQQINQDFLQILFSAVWQGFVFSKLSINGGSSDLSTFNLAKCVMIKNALTLNKLPDTVRWVLLFSSYHDAILTDSNLLSAKAILSLIKKDMGSFEDGELPVLFGLRILESQLAASKAGQLVTITDPTKIPTQADTIGFAGNSASALFVARIPQDYTKVIPDIPATAALEIITEPDSGLSMLVTKRIDHNLQATFVKMGLMYNFAQGDPRQGLPLNP